jgi:alkanesulfonate monooxygenase SsuD/methylene tetrahydromethanopterin reductase-like flavin-dependent oxidoreductase (luciferase family)
VSFADVIQRPRPRQRPRPAIVCGGHSPPALRRAAETADGWYGWDLGPEQAAAALDDLRDAERRSERPARRPPLEVTITPPDGIDAATVERYSELGVDRLVVQPATSGGAEIDDLIEHVGRPLMPAAGGARS